MRSDLDFVARRSTALVLFLVGGLVAACGSTTPSASPSSAVQTEAPSASTPASGPSATLSSSPSSSPAGSAAAADCAAADLTVTGGPWGGAAGSRGTDVTVESKSVSACQLPASPAVVALDAGGAVVAQGKFGAVGSGPELQPGGHEKFSLEFSNWCNQNVRLPMHFALRLATGSTEIAQAAITSADELPPCNGPGQPVSLSTTAWES